MPFGVLVCGSLLAADAASSGDVRMIQIVVAVVGAAAIGSRRVLPALALAAIAVALTAQLGAIGEVRAVDAALLVVLYSSWAWGAVPTRVTSVAVAVVAAGAAAVSTPFAVGPSAASSAVNVALTVITASLAACGLGLLSRTRRALTEQLRLRAERAEAEQRRVAELTAERERARMARDVHDVVAHSLTVIAVQAQAGSFAASTRPDDANAGATLDAIARTAKDALTEVRGVLRALRSTETAVVHDIELDALVARTREAGLMVALEEHGAARQLPEPTGRAVQFLVREALTNSLRHAGPGTQARVTLDWGPEALEVVVLDDGGGTPEWHSPGTGLGLVGMRERISAVGGLVDHGPADIGFRVAATVPAP